MSCSNRIPMGRAEENICAGDILEMLPDKGLVRKLRDQTVEMFTKDPDKKTIHEKEWVWLVWSYHAPDFPPSVGRKLRGVFYNQKTAARYARLIWDEIGETSFEPGATVRIECEPEELIR